MKPMLLTGVLLGALFTGSVHAGHCPKDAAAIKHALENSSIGMTEKQEIMALTEKGMALHSAGDHRESEKVLADAMRKVLMSK